MTKELSSSPQYFTLCKWCNYHINDISFLFSWWLLFYRENTRNFNNCNDYLFVCSGIFK